MILALPLACGGAEGNDPPAEDGGGRFQRRRQSADYSFPTKALSDAGDDSTVSYRGVIDHHLVTDELAALYQAGSAEVYRVDQYIPNYGATTSDHYPTLARYSLDGL